MICTASYVWLCLVEVVKDSSGKNEHIQKRSHLDKSGGLAKVPYFKVAYQTLSSVIFVVLPSDPCVFPQFSN